MTPSEATPTDTPAPDQSQRSLAALAYFGHLLGLWLVAPVAIYLLRRQHSHFVAHHAARAFLLHLLFVPLGAALAIVSFYLGIGAYALLGGVTSINPGANLGITMLTLGLTGLAPLAILLLITLVAAMRALRGRLDCSSWLGRGAEWLLRQDPGVPRE